MVALHLDLAMELMPPEDFARWAAARAIAVDVESARKPPSHWPSDVDYQDGKSESRFWSYPEGAGKNKRMFVALLGLLSVDSSFVVWPDASGFCSFDNKLDNTQFPVDSPFRPYINAKTPGALVVPAAMVMELADFLVFVADIAVHAWHDVTVMPYDGSVILKFSHHDVVWAYTRDKLHLESLITEMADRQYPLPTEYPDSTFKPQPWMDARLTDTPEPRGPFPRMLARLSELFSRRRS